MPTSSSSASLRHLIFLLTLDSFSSRFFCIVHFSSSLVVPISPPPAPALPSRSDPYHNISNTSALTKPIHPSEQPAHAALSLPSFPPSLPACGTSPRPLAPSQSALGTDQPTSQPTCMRDTVSQHPFWPRARPHPTSKAVVSACFACLTTLVQSSSRHQSPRPREILLPCTRHLAHPLTLTFGR